MHLYSNGSNARAAARKLVGKYPALITVAFPVRAPGDSGTYYAAVAYIDGANPTAEEKAAIADAAQVVDTDAEPPLESKAGDAPAPRAKARKARKSKKAVKAEARVKPPKRESKAATALALMSVPGGATAESLIEAMGWQPHTLRGFVSNENRLNGRGIETLRKTGEPTRYILK